MLVYFSCFWGKIYLRRGNIGNEESILSYSLKECGLWGVVWEQDPEGGGDIAFADRKQRIRIVTAQPVESGHSQGTVFLTVRVGLSTTINLT